MTTLSALLDDLRHSSAFAALDAYSNAFDLFKVMDVRSKELIHSNILAALMSEGEPHGLGSVFLDAFVSSLGELRCMGTPLARDVLDSAAGAKAKISRELEHIDLLIEFPLRKLVIAVENKIWAAEQPEQIKRYQRTLCDRYPGYERALVYLTPLGKQPDTADPSSSVPVYCMPYGCVARQLRQSKSSATVQAAQFIEQFIAHVEKYMSGNRELDDLCWALFKQHEEAYRHLVESYEYCIRLKVEQAFETIQSRIRDDGMFSAWVGLVEMSASSLPDRKNLLNFDLDVRLVHWPEGLRVKVYKHTWFAVFPYVRGADTVRLRAVMPGYFESPRPVPDWDDHYFASAGFVGREQRCVRPKGNELDETDINMALTMVRDCIDEINAALKTTTH
ncbi:PD-(D/E)XK nuclease family protein [Pseudomonas sp. LABIM340]|uniref:PDDEXK-like family protein n=1 Tax=Pseudomonas sp. LABIM340 TaxID=3156585 RepID=UPI0032AFE5B6